MTFSDAFGNIRAAVASGKALDDAIIEVAAEFELNPNLLSRMIKENGFTEEGIRKYVVQTKAELFHKNKLEAAINYCLKNHALNRDEFTGAEFTDFFGKKYTYVGKCRVPRKDGHDFCIASDIESDTKRRCILVTKHHLDDHSLMVNQTKK